MPIDFPAAVEIPLSSPPLDEVVCQVRYPPILRISQEEPAHFQELIRKRFPEFDKQQPLQIKLAPPGNSSESSVELRPIIYQFTNAANKSQAVLSSTFYAVSTTKYNSWRSFLEDLKTVHEAVINTYQPAYATRVGLRYINRLTAENTGTTTREELLSMVRSELTAVLHGRVWDDVSEMIGVVSFNDSPAQLNVRFGYEVKEKAPTFLVDFDYFEEGQIDLNEVLTRCDRYHEAIYQAFRWMVKDESLERFGGDTQWQ